MASLWEMLMGGGQPQAQMPGMSAQPQNPLQRLLDPSFALPMAAGMMGSGGNMQNIGQGFANAAPMMALRRKQEQETAQRNQTVDYLRKNNPELAAMVDAGMPVTEAWGELTRQKFQKPDKSQGFINAGGGNLFNSETGEWVSAPGGGIDAVAGLQPVWLRDEKTGQPVLGQMRKDGSVVRSAMPDGTNAIGPYDVNFDKAAGTASGKGAGEAATALPGVRLMGAKVSQDVESLKNDKYLDSMLGPINSRLPNWSSESARVQGKIQQLAGESFLAARAALRGGGAITDYEGQKAEEALARLNQAQSPEDFKGALDDFNEHVQRGIQILELQAGQQRMDQGGMPGPQGAPQGGGTDYKTKYGLD